MFVISLALGGEYFNLPAEGGLDAAVFVYLEEVNLSEVTYPVVDTVSLWYCSNVN